MNITMIDTNLHDIAGIERFVDSIPTVEFSSVSKEESYEWIKAVLNRFSFRKLKKKERGKVRAYIQKVTGYSPSQLSRLIAKYVQGQLQVVTYQRHSFSTRYTLSDIALLVTTDNIHQRLNGKATKHILWREYFVFKRQEYERLSQISVSHLYRLRQTRTYQTNSLILTKTQAVQRAIGERRKPEPQGKPGYIRVDTVHQGDTKEGKGVYHINSVDEVTQWEIVASVEKISEAYLEAILKLMLAQYPFVIVEFHADNGSEYINYTVAKLLNKLLIKLTKSRSRQTNDNALVESKNGSVIRKHMGYFYISQTYAPLINDFYVSTFNTYLNFHRPCAFPTITMDKKGKQKKEYKEYMTPYEAFTKIPDAQKCLKNGVTLKKLEAVAKEYSDNEYAAKMDQRKQLLFDTIALKPIDF